MSQIIEFHGAHAIFIVAESKETPSEHTKSAKATYPRPFIACGKGLKSTPALNHKSILTVTGGP